MTERPLVRILGCSQSQFCCVTLSSCVAELHDIHMCSLGAGHDAVIAHIHEDGTEKDLTAKLVAKLREVTGAEYVTVQVERPGEHCDAPPSRYTESE